jgi:hypothetical protein
LLWLLIGIGGCLMNAEAITVKLQKISDKEHMSKTSEFIQAWRSKLDASHWTDNIKYSETIKDTSIHMQNYMNTQYMGGVYVGSPARQFNVVFDTGSANFWLYGQMASPQNCDTSRYSPEMSRTSSIPERCRSTGDGVDVCKWAVEYGGGSIKAQVRADDMIVGNIVLKNLEFGEVYDVRGDFGDAEGIIGLAFSNLLSDKSTPLLLDVMLQSGQITSAEFAVYLSNLGSSNFESEITFGHTKPHLHTQPFVYHNLTDESNYWSLEMLDFLVDGVSIFGEESCMTSSLGFCRLVVDTGTSFLTAPSAHATKIMSLVKATGTIGCSVVEQLPDITYVLPGASYTISAMDYIIVSDSYMGSHECVAGEHMHPWLFCTMHTLYQIIV